MDEVCDRPSVAQCLLQRSTLIDFPSHHLPMVSGVYNLFDEAYRIHGSGIDGYGRSAWIGTRVRFH